MSRALPGFAIVLMLLLMGCGSPLVGAECLDGHVVCDGVCVDLASDADHCGGCGTSCGAFECVAARCSERLRAGIDLDGGLLPDGATAGDGSRSGDGGSDRGGPGQTPIGAGTPFLPDGGLEFPDLSVAVGCALGQTACGSMCSALSSDPSHCGACGVRCDDDQFCIDGSCEDACDPPLEACGRACVRFDEDPNHCGGCNRECRSGLCEAGECADVVAGHLVVVGHDYATGRAETMRRMAGNALFLARGAPVRALVYRGEASSASVNGVNAAIDRIVALDGRDWEQVEADVDAVPRQLLDASAFIVHAQHGATDAELEELGQRWGMALTQFLLRGGVVVLFETASEDNAGTYRLLEPAGLFEADAREEVSGGTLTVVSPGVGVAARTTRNYNAADVTVHFLGEAGGGQVVVEDESGEAVVVHRVVAP